MFNVLSEIRNFSSGKLRKVQTKVLTSDGRQLIETRDKHGRIISKETGKIAPGFVADVKPDLQVGEILPGLLLGSQDVAQDLPLLQKHKVSHILNLASGVENAFGDTFIYKKLNVLDLPETNIRKCFDECFNFIDEARKNNGVVLVHCNAGISRSAAVVIAYVMKTQGLRYEQAFEMVKSKRSIKPNEGFLNQLKSYDSELNAPPAKVNTPQQPQQQNQVAASLPKQTPAPPAQKTPQPPPPPQQQKQPIVNQNPPARVQQIQKSAPQPQPSEEDDESEYTEEEYTDTEEESEEEPAKPPVKPPVNKR
uniref:protein-serine/threonine phosphatase n=1 Tax=Scolopendra viridis TaxID=118503 RepID=A0A4D5R988_SCOVI